MTEQLGGNLLGQIPCRTDDLRAVRGKGARSLHADPSGNASDEDPFAVEDSCRHNAVIEVANTIGNNNTIPPRCCLLANRYSFGWAVDCCLTEARRMGGSTPRKTRHINANANRPYAPIATAKKIA